MNNQKLKGIWIPVQIILDENLSDKEKIILSIILYLSKETGSCFASNKYLANIVNVTSDRISKIVSMLHKKKYIEVKLKYKLQSKEVENRQIIPNKSKMLLYTQSIGKNNYSNSSKEPYPIGENNQDMVNTYDVVQDTGLIENTNNTILFGHNNRSFSILEEVNCGEIITLNNFGVEKSYQVEKSELGILSDDETDILTINDGNFVIYQDYVFHALILITCANNYNWNYRWIIVARELD